MFDGCSIQEWRAKRAYPWLFSFAPSARGGRQDVCAPNDCRAFSVKRVAFEKRCLPLTAYCLLLTSYFGTPGMMVALKVSRRVLCPRWSALGSSLVFSNTILKPASFEPFVTAPRQA